MKPDLTSVSQQVSQLEQLYTTAPIGLDFLDTELRYVRINDRMALMNGRPAAEHIGRTIREIMPELAPQLEPVFRELLETGESIRDLEVSGTTPAGPRERTWLCNYSRVTSSEGRVLGVSGVVQDITDVKQVEKKSAQIGDYLDTILLNLPVGIAILEGEDFRYFRINQRLADMNGLSIEDHLGKTVAEVLPHAQHILPNLRKVRDAGEPTLYREFTTRLPSNPEQDVHLMDFHFPIVVDGSVRAVGAVVLDVTRRKEAEIALRQSQADLEERVKERTAELTAVNVALNTEAAERDKVEIKLRDSEQRLRWLLETTQAMPWVCDGKTFQFTYVGPRAVELLGYPPDQWYDDDFWPDHIHPDDRDAAVDHCLTSSRHLSEFELEYRMIAADGRIVWVRDLVNVVREDGELAMLHGFMIDVTAEREADLKRRAAEDHAHRLLETAPDATFLVARDGTVTEANKQAETMFGYDKQELLDLKIEALIPTRFLEQHRDHRERYSRDPYQRTMGGGLELIALRKDGTEFPIEASISPLKGEDAALVVCDIRDITERKAAEGEMRLLRQELAHVTRVATMGVLAGSLAHEINQPLSAIVLNAQAGRSFLDRPTPVTDEASEALTEIAEDAKRAGEVIHRLQALLKKKESEREALDINELVEQVGMLLHSDAVTRAIPIQLDLARNLPQALGDRVQLQQVVLNLMLNGFEAMTEAPPTGVNELTVRTATGEEDLIVVAVQDSGCGLDPAIGERAFEAFATTKPDGLGMGLSVNRSIVEAHGGTMWMTQNPDRGVTVSFTLTVAPVANP